LERFPWDSAALIYVCRTVWPQRGYSVDESRHRPAYRWRTVTHQSACQADTGVLLHVLWLGVAVLSFPALWILRAGAPVIACVCRLQHYW